MGCPFPGECKSAGNCSTPLPDEPETISEATLDEIEAAAEIATQQFENARAIASYTMRAAIAALRDLAGLDPSRPLSIAITNAETADLWLEQALG